MRLAVLTCCILLAAAAWGQGPATQPTAQVVQPVPATWPATQAARPDNISMDRQLLLKRKLLMGHESLIAVLQSNRLNWDRYSPEQRQVLRQRAYAFRQADPTQQEQVLDAWESFLKLNDAQKLRYRQRAAWLTAVISELPQEKRDELIKLPPAERAHRLLELKKQIEEQGKGPVPEQQIQNSKSETNPNPEPK
jgi:hypothetical protein